MGDLFAFKAETGLYLIMAQSTEEAKEKFTARLKEEHPDIEDPWEWAGVTQHPVSWEYDMWVVKLDDQI